MELRGSQGQIELTQGELRDHTESSETNHAGEGGTGTMLTGSRVCLTRTGQFHGLATHENPLIAGFQNNFRLTHSPPLDASPRKKILKIQIRVKKAIFQAYVCSDPREIVLETRNN